MMATKTTASPPTRILQSTYGPIGSGIPRSQPQPIQRPNPPMEPTEENPMRAAELGNPNATMPRPMQGPAMNGMMNQSQSAAPQHASMISISSAVSPQNQTLSHSVSANHSEMMQNQMYRPSLSSVPTPIGMTAEGTPRSSVGVTPVRGINNNFQNATAEEKGSSFGNRLMFLMFKFIISSSFHSSINPLSDLLPLQQLFHALGRFKRVVE